MAWIKCATLALFLFSLFNLGRADPTFNYAALGPDFFGEYQLLTANAEYPVSVGEGYLGINGDIHVQYGRICDQWSTWINCPINESSCGVNRFFYTRADYSIPSSLGNAWFAGGGYKCPFQESVVGQPSGCFYDWEQPSDGAPPPFWEKIAEYSTSVGYSNNQSFCQAVFEDLNFPSNSLCAHTLTTYHACQLFQSKIIGGVRFQTIIAYTNDQGTNEGPLVCQFQQAWPGYENYYRFTSYTTTNLSTIPQFDLPEYCEGYEPPSNGSCTSQSCSSGATAPETLKKPKKPKKPKRNTKNKKPSPLTAEQMTANSNTPLTCSATVSPPPISLFQDFIYPTTIGSNVKLGLGSYIGKVYLAESSGSVISNGKKFSRERFYAVFSYPDQLGVPDQVYVQNCADNVAYFNSDNTTTDNSLFLGATADTKNPLLYLPKCYHGDSGFNNAFFDDKTAFFDFLDDADLRYLGCYESDTPQTAYHKGFYAWDVPYPVWPTNNPPGPSNTSFENNPEMISYWWSLSVGGVNITVSFLIDYYDPVTDTWAADTMPTVVRRTELVNFQWFYTNMIKTPPTSDNFMLVWNDRNPASDSSLLCDQEPPSVRLFVHTETAESSPFTCAEDPCPPPAPPPPPPPP